MKIALVQCPGWGRDCPPYAIALLSAIMRKEGHTVFGFDLNNALYCSGPDKYRKMWDDKDLYSFWNNESLIGEFIRDNSRMIDFTVDRIAGSGAKIIGFTVHFTSLLLSLEIARRVKKAAPDRIVVFGGPDCCRELRGPAIIKEEAVDIVAVGEGDETLPELARLASAGEIDFCVGTLLKKNGKVVDCGDRPAVKDINALPFPDYSDFRKDILCGHYRQPERLEILDSRGCITCCHFCSEWQFWKTFRSMSGERMFEEVAYQISRFPGVNYFYFIGSLLNGDPGALSRFCDLLLDNDVKIRWLGQAVIRPEMDAGLLQKMRKAGCEWLGYGIESGSEKVVHGVNKRFSIATAEEVLRQTHRAGICTQANIMFGIPGETREDFKQTLEFLRRNRENMDSVLASQSFCVIDKGTYLHTHATELGILNADHHLFWETDGNDYPERFRRYEEFCRLALSLGLPETSGVLKVKPDKWSLLGEYHLFKKDYAKAAECLEKSLSLESRNETTLRKLEECRQAQGAAAVTAVPAQQGAAEECSHTAVQEKEPADGRALNDVQRRIAEALAGRGLKVKLDNFLLLEREKQERRETVTAFPYWLTVDPANFCMLRCPFCPTGQRRGSRTKGVLSPDNFRKIIDELGPYLLHIDFCNWGEPLLNKDISAMIHLAKQHHVDTKVDSNLNQLTEKDAEGLVLAGLDKIIVSIDGASAETYSKYRVGGDFGKAMDNLKTLIRKRREAGRSNPHITWQFLVFRHNEHEIGLAKQMGADLGVDNVSITNAFIGDKEWIPLNEEHSRYRKDEIKEELTSEHFKPGQDSSCNWLWEAITVNPNGSVSPCCSVEDEKNDFDNIFERNFKDIWNNGKYRQARRFIKDGTVAAGDGPNICVGCRHSGLINLDILSCHSFFNPPKT